MDEELKTTIEGLCSELFNVGLEDSNPLMQTISALCLQSSKYQRLVGTQFSTTTRNLNKFASRFLYEPKTATNALYFLAALAFENPLNQMKILDEVRSVEVNMTARELHASSILILTIPQSVKDTYKKWKTRSKELQGRRVPTGNPPKEDGIPQPCLCNECLGAPRLLSTWKQHFEDLSKWNLQSWKMAPFQFSTQAFLEIFLQKCDVGRLSIPVILGPRTCEVLYFSLSQEHSDSFDPIKHVAGIRISPNLHVPTSLQEKCEVMLLQSAEDEEIESVLLHEANECVQLCMSSQSNIFRQNVNIQIVAQISHCSLAISCKNQKGENEYSTVTNLSHAQTGWDLARLSTCMIQMILKSCRICHRNKRSTSCDADAICLHSTRKVSHQGNKSIGLELQVPMQGLCSTSISTLNLRLEELKICEQPERVDLELLFQSCRTVIDRCNDRIKLLLQGRQPNIEGARLAAADRARRCRDKLIAMSKQVKVMSKKKASMSKVVKYIMRGLNDILKCSSTFDCWEIPDPRVEKLKLSPAIWHSGLPDQEFYLQRGERSKRSRSKQQ